MSDRYALMAAERAEFPVRMMARLLGVSASGFYSWASSHSSPEPPADPWGPLRAEVMRLWLASGRRWGARTIFSQARGRFSGATLYRVRRCMRELGIRGVYPPRRVRTTVPDPSAPDRPDLLRRDFASPVPTTRLVGDITYLRTGQGWLYLAAVIDLATRMVVGWCMSERMTADIAVSALEMARGRGYVAGGAIFHSDRGSQYTSLLLARWAEANDVRLSVGRTGSCHDNAVAESFFGTLKNEMYHLRTFATRAEARAAVIEYVEGYYNRRRPHSTVGYRVPAELMREFLGRAEAAFAPEGGQVPLAA